MVDVSTLLTLVTSATVVVVIIYYAFQTKTRTRLRENLLKVKNDILQAEKEFVSLYDSPRYFSKRDMHLWKQRWSHIAQLVEQCVRKRNLDLDFQNSITTVADVYQKGERLLEKRNAAFIEKEIVAFRKVSLELGHCNFSGSSSPRRLEHGLFLLHPTTVL